LPTLRSNGNQQKPPDVHAAVDAANQAADHVLDGSNVRFMVSTGGQITATVKKPRLPAAAVFDLSPDQFRQISERRWRWPVRQADAAGRDRSYTY